jgi:hypothetical protein
MQVLPRQLKDLAGTWAAVRHIPPSRILARLRRLRRTRRLLSKPESILCASLSEDEFNRAIERLQDSRMVSAARRLKELTASTYAYDAGTATVCFRESGDSYTSDDIESIPWNDMKSIPASDVNRCFFIAFVEHACLLSGDAAAHLKSLHSYVSRLAAAAPIAGDRLCIPWQPLTAARRLVNLLCALSLILNCDPSLAHASELEFLIQHLAVLNRIVSCLREDDLAYNHLASQLFALSLYAWVFDSHTNAMAACSRFIACVEEQVGADGMQMERSATYQAHVLGYVEVLRAGRLATELLEDDPIPIDAPIPIEDKLNALADRMRSALAVLTHPDGSIAVLNDAAIGDGPSPLALGISLASRPNGITLLPDAGYARLVAGDFSGVFDAGPSGPDDNPGHAHADFLSLEIVFRKQLLLADPGVATYKSGAERDWTRSASTHNGPAFSGLEPLEFLGPFRIGRRGKAHFLPPLGLDAPVETAGWQDGFDRFGGRVARWVGMWPNEAVMIVDIWNGIEERDAFSSFLIPDSWKIRASDTVNPDPKKLTLTSSRSGDSIYISVINGSLTIDHSAKYFPYGPRTPRKAARITLRPSTGSVNRSAAFVIRPEDSNLRSLPIDSTFTRCEILLAAAIEKHKGKPRGEMA